MKSQAIRLGAALASLSIVNTFADVKLPAIFGDHMVLQRDQPVRVWGWDKSAQKVLVEFAGQKAEAVADGSGKWCASLAPLPASAESRDLKVTGSSSVTLQDVVVGEVWLCSGQSNMQWNVGSAYDADLVALTCTDPQIRLITVPQVGTQEPQNDFAGKWETAAPDVVKDFSAVGYLYGRLLHEAIQVPVGLIDNSWGGSAAEAWVPRNLLEANPIYKPFLDDWVQKETNVEANTVKWKADMEVWKKKAAEATAAKLPVPRAPNSPEAEMKGQHRPGNLYNGVLKPIIGYTIRGAIWYQGETNAGRAYAYRTLFPFMIQQWRKEWGQGDFPFYWVQLADFMDEKPEPGPSGWAELREAQTMTLSLPRTGQAVIIDRGEAKDIHPKDKQTVANRLARLALANDYGISIVSQSPRYASHQVQGSKVIVQFTQVGGGLSTFDVRNAKGFAVAGADQVFHWAEGKVIAPDKMEVSCSQVPNPLAVRYAWADNPVANVLNKEGLPLTPFRTDDWPAITNPEAGTPKTGKP